MSGEWGPPARLQSQRKKFPLKVVGILEAYLEDPAGFLLEGIHYPRATSSKDGQVPDLADLIGGPVRQLIGQAVASTQQPREVTLSSEAMAWPISCLTGPRMRSSKSGT